MIMLRYIVFACALAVFTDKGWCGAAETVTAPRDTNSIATDANPHERAPVEISGALRQWHKVTLDLEGPFARESDTAPNPFTDYRMTVTFAHESGQLVYEVPGYFAADGDAADTSADAGTCWRAHLSPDRPGRWDYRISFVQGHHVAVDDAAPSQPVNACDGASGSFRILATDKTGRDFRARGRLQYVGKRSSAVRRNR